MRNVLRDVEHYEDQELLVGLARAHRRAMKDFCADPRLIPVGYVPLHDIDGAIAFARELLDDGVRAIEIPGDCPKHHSPSHVGFEPLWAMLAEAGVPVMFHLGSSRIAPITFHENGRPVEKFFAGGDVPRLGSLEYISSPWPVQEILTALLVDGVLQRHPDLRFGLIELGASWMPGYMKHLDSAQVAFSKAEGRLHRLDLKPSEYLQRQVRITPFCHEDVGWLIQQVGPDMALFSSDYPHIEGGRNPIGRFEAALGERPAAVRDKFYADNFLRIFPEAA
jgi:predicted TIM-barrel fold metal-dependent hydrolase